MAGRRCTRTAASDMREMRSLVAVGQPHNVSALPIGHIVRASTSCERLGNDSSRDRGSSNKHHGQDVDQEDAQRRQPRAQPPGCCRRPGYKCIY